MHDLLTTIAEAGGAAGRRYLNAHGFPDRMLRDAVRSGALRRPRRGWYSVWARDDPRYRAVRVGGRLTGLAAVRALGGWVLHDPPLQVAVPRNAARLRDPERRGGFRSRRRGARLLWRSERHDADTTTGIVPVLEALEVVIRTAPLEDAIAALDWACRTGAVDADGLRELASSIPRHRRPVLAAVDPRCDSLPESLVRTRLAALGLDVRSQVPVVGASPIDLVVEGTVAIEVDGDAFHRDRFEGDRAKDLAITVAGMHALRPSARQVFHDWGVVRAAVLRALRERGLGGALTAIPPPGRRNTPRRRALPSA